MTAYNPIINGQIYSWANLSIDLLGSTLPLTMVSKISYTMKQVNNNIYGAWVQPIGISYGHYEYSGSIELHANEWLNICQNTGIVLGNTNDPLQLSPFQINVSFGINPQNAQSIAAFPVSYTDTLSNVRFLESPMTSSTGDTAIMMTVPFIYAGLSRFQ